MKRPINFIFFALTLIFCFFSAGSITAEKTDKKNALATIFLTGSELGSLKPCGCSGGQLGGLDRRPAVFDQAKPQNRMIIDTGSLVEGFGEQDMIKFNTIMQAFGLLGYDVVNFTAKDTELASALGLSDPQAFSFDIVTNTQTIDVNLPPSFSKLLKTSAGPLIVTVASVDIESQGTEALDEIFTLDCENPAVNILVTNTCDPDILEEISTFELVDCVICPSEADEAVMMSDPDQRPLIFTVGRFGKYISKLSVTDITPGQKPQISFESVAVIEDLPQTKELIDLYKVYQHLVKDAGLLERYPRFHLEDGLSYTGSKSCRMCHGYEYDKWSTKAHADAYATLVEVGSDYDPDCVTCHVVGMEYESGFITEKTTPHLKNVGCEVCHGPGSEHIASYGETKTTGPQRDCADCHTPDHSAEYAGHEDEYFEKIIHWKEQNLADDVKKSKSSEK